MKTQPRPQIGVICVNLGTPSSPRPAAVRRYLKAFFRDDRLITSPLVRALISTLLPWIRARSSAAKYAKIWQKSPPIHAELKAYLHRTELDATLSSEAIGSPLLYHSLHLTCQLQQALDGEPSDYVVQLAMNLGEPSLKRGLEWLSSRGITKLVVVPLFPQYASCTFGATLARMYNLTAQSWHVPALQVIPPFGLDPGYINVLALQLGQTLDQLAARAGSYHVLISFHGLPLSSCLQPPTALPPPRYACGDPEGRCCQSPHEPTTAACYRRQCIQSAHELATACSLAKEHYTVSFQSKVGPQQWTAPSTVAVLAELPLKQRGLKDVIIMCPSFITDCLETLEEIQLEAKAHLEAQHPQLRITVVPCINDHPAFTQWLVTKIRQHAEDPHQR